MTSPLSGLRRLPQGDLGQPAFFVSADRWAFGPGDVVPADEGLRARGESAPRPARRRPQLFEGRGARRRRNKGLRGGRHHVRPAVGLSQPQPAEESKLSRPIYRKIILTQLANVFNPEKPNNKFKIPLFSTHSCRMKTNVY